MLEYAIDYTVFEEALPRFHQISAPNLVKCIKTLERYIELPCL
jgi:hypothetical protein